MTEKKKENCAHGSFKCEQTGVEGLGVVVSVIRCKDCGEAISTFLPDIPLFLNKMNTKLNKIHSDIKKLMG